MKQKLGPVVLILFLVFILTFILGVKYGQRVEKVNKTIDYLVSIPPTKPVPTTAPIEFKDYTNTTCGVKFLYPSGLTLKDQSQNGYARGPIDEADFYQNDLLRIHLTCAGHWLRFETSHGGTLRDDITKRATEEVTLQGKKMKVTSTREKDGSFLYLRLTNPISSQPVGIIVEKSLYPLLEKSLTFIKPETNPTFPPLQKTVTP